MVQSQGVVIDAVRAARSGNLKPISHLKAVCQDDHELEILNQMIDKAIQILDKTDEYQVSI